MPAPSPPTPLVIPIPDAPGYSAWVQSTLVEVTSVSIPNATAADGINLLVSSSNAIPPGSTSLARSYLYVGPIVQAPVFPPGLFYATQRLPSQNGNALTAGLSAELLGALEDGAGGGGVPVVANPSPRKGSPVPVFATAQVLRASAGVIFGVSAFTGTSGDASDTMPAGNYWLLLVDAAAEPAPGAVTPITVLFDFHTVGFVDDNIMGDEVAGVEVDVGAVLLLSSTGPDVYTPLGAYMIATASVSV